MVTRLVIFYPSISNQDFRNSLSKILLTKTFDQVDIILDDDILLPVDNVGSRVNIKSELISTLKPHKFFKKEEEISSLIRKNAKIYQKIFDEILNINEYLNALFYIRTLEDLKAIALFLSFFKLKEKFNFFHIVILDSTFKKSEQAFPLFERILLAHDIQIYTSLEVIKRVKENLSLDTLNLNKINNLTELINENDNNLDYLFIYLNKKSNSRNFGYLDRNARENIEKNILFIDKNIPNPKTNAASYAIIQEMKILKKLNYNIFFINLNDGYEDKSLHELLESFGIRLLAFPNAFEFNDFLEKYSKNIFFYYVTRFDNAENVINKIRINNSNSKIILNLADLHYLRETRRSIIENDQNLFLSAENIKSRELSVIKGVDLVLTYSQFEKDLLIKEEKISVPIEICPWVEDVTRAKNDFNSRCDIVFIGGFGHPPNIDGVIWFIKNVMPLLRIEIPGIKFLICGFGIPNEIIKYHSDDIIIKGYVDSTFEILDLCKISVAPLRFGAGIKGKVLSALGRSVPVVMSSIAAEGIINNSSKFLCIAESPLDWVNAIKNLYLNQKAWESLSEAQFNYSLKHFSFENALVRFKKIFEIFN